MIKIWIKSASIIEIRESYIQVMLNDAEVCFSLQQGRMPRCLYMCCLFVLTICVSHYLFDLLQIGKTESKSGMEISCDDTFVYHDREVKLDEAKMKFSLFSAEKGKAG